MAGTNAGADNSANNTNTGANGADTKGVETQKNTGAGAESNSEGEQTKTASQIFDEALKGEGQQAEFDRRVNKALETQKTKLTADIQKQIDAAVDEALKKEKMSDDEKAEYSKKKAEEALTKREAAITRREVKATARELLAEKKLPAGLIDIVNCDSEDAMKASIETIEKTYAASVEDSVNERLKGGKVPDKAQGGGAPSLAEQIKKAMNG